MEEGGGSDLVEGGGGLRFGGGGGLRLGEGELVPPPVVSGEGPLGRRVLLSPPGSLCLFLPLVLSMAGLTGSRSPSSLLSSALHSIVSSSSQACPNRRLISRIITDAGLSPSHSGN